MDLGEECEAIEFGVRDVMKSTDRSVKKMRNETAWKPIMVLGSFSNDCLEFPVRFGHGMGTEWARS